MHGRGHERTEDGAAKKARAAEPDFAAASPASVLMQLQRTAGNRAVVGLIQRKKLDGPDLEKAKGICLRNMATSEPFYANKFKKGGVRAALEKKHEVDDEDVRDLDTYLESHRQAHPKTDFDSVVAELAAGTARTDNVQFLSGLAWGGRKPAIVFGPTLTTGFFDTTFNVITLDPVKNATADELLDTLTFECQNALQRSKLSSAQKKEEKERGRAVAEVEFESDRMYTQALLQINQASDFDQLVQKLAVPAKYLKEADYATSLQNKKVERPDRSEFPAQDKRQALWWWKTKGWNDDQRKQVWIAENHGDDVGATEEIYAK